jgi:hypothetical protein
MSYNLAITCTLLYRMHTGGGVGHSVRLSREYSGTEPLFGRKPTATAGISTGTTAAAAVPAMTIAQRASAYKAARVQSSDLKQVAPVEQEDEVVRFS